MAVIRVEKERLWLKEVRNKFELIGGSGVREFDNFEQALAEAKKGLSEGGLPIGSVLVDSRTGETVSRGHNMRVQTGGNFFRFVFFGRVNVRVCIHSRRPHGPRRGGGDTERRQEERLGQSRPRIHAQVQTTVESVCFWAKKAGAKISRKVVDSNKNKMITKKKKKKTCGRPVWSSAQRKKKAKSVF